MTRIIITGSKGRMGKALMTCAGHNPELEVAGQIDEGDDLSRVIGKGDVVIDFSLHTVTLGIASVCAANRI